jgi:hypothetical protein
MPDDVYTNDEGAIRMQIKNLACTSLELLKIAIFDKECEARIPPSQFDILSVPSFPTSIFYS